MSWVLILTPNGRDKYPAVIGGYATKEAAEMAGGVACGPPQHILDAMKYEHTATRELLRWRTLSGMLVSKVGQQVVEDDGCWMLTSGSSYAWEPDWTGYTVIPGAASVSPDTLAGESKS